MLIKIREIRPKARETMVGRIYGNGKFWLSLEWNRDGVMHSESGGDDDDDDELVRDWE